MKSAMIFSAAILCGLLVLPAVSSAGKTPSLKKQAAYQRELFARLDGDNNGTVTEREYVVGILYTLFVQHDESGNGQITKKEFFRLAAKDRSLEEAEREYALMDPEDRGFFSFEDLFENTYALDDLRAEWADLMDALGKKTGDSISLADLPDLDPES